ncbi:MAG: hypothetical protein GF347_03110, partial [Candidatus Moranbacteria bacterium]|nr:hypothetical protein [Candidatus Moranbacteria bacterium]
KEQSGFVQTVGFDLYCKILDQAVKELKEGKPTTDQENKPEDSLSLEGQYPDTKLDMDFDLLIPEHFIEDELERITIYHRLVNFSEIKQIDQLQKELSDRFGTIPQQVFFFLMAIKIKILARRLFADRIILKNNQFKIIFSDRAKNDDHFYDELIPGLMNQNITKVQFLNTKVLGLKVDLKGEEKTEQLQFAINFLEKVQLNN